MFKLDHKNMIAIFYPLFDSRFVKNRKQLDLANAI